MGTQVLRHLSGPEGAVFATSPCRQNVVVQHQLAELLCRESHLPSTKPGRDHSPAGGKLEGLGDPECLSVVNLNVGSGPSWRRVACNANPRGKQG